MSCHNKKDNKEKGNDGKHECALIQFQVKQNISRIAQCRMSESVLRTTYWDNDNKQKTGPYLMF